MVQHTAQDLAGMVVKEAEEAEQLVQVEQAEQVVLILARLALRAPIMPGLMCPVVMLVSTLALEAEEVVTTMQIIRADSGDLV